MAVAERLRAVLAEGLAHGPGHSGEPGWEVSVLCTFDGVPCRVLKSLGETVVLELVEGDPATGERLGGRHVDVGVYELQAPRRRSRLATASSASCPCLAWRAVDRPIGMFDSGFGGLTVARAADRPAAGRGPRLHRRHRPLPVRAQAAAPTSAATPASWRGAWSRTTTSRPSIVACNTAAAAGLDDLRGELPVPVLDVIGPGAAALVEATTQRPGRRDRHRRHDGVGRLRARRRRGGGRSPASTVELESAACPGFVEFVERGQTTGDEVTVLAERLLAPVRAADVDALLLGCTHYPFLARVIGDVMGHGVTLVSSADETAFAARARARRARPAARRRRPRGEHRFLSSGDIDTFRELGAAAARPRAQPHRPLGPPGGLTREDPPCPAPTAAPPTSCARSRSSATSRRWPTARASCRSAGPACCARRASTTTCRAGCAAAARAG